MINVAELLKNCPKGMELECTMFKNLVFSEVDLEAHDYPIIATLPNGAEKYFTSDGRYELISDAKCVIFPKGKTTWEGFKPPCKFKDGDILTNARGSIFIYKGPLYYNKQLADFYCGYRIADETFILKVFTDRHFGDVSECRLAIGEEKAKLFQAIKVHGYKWNAETKTLKKLIEPKFKAGSKVKNKDNFIVTIVRIDGDYYDYVNEDGQCGVIYIRSQNEWELVPDKFDITTLKPFESKVLVRDSEAEKWKLAIWGYYDSDNIYNYPYEVVGGLSYRICIPYEGNEHLRGTTDDCNEYYKN